MIASLPMYDLPEVRAATDAWWAGLARAFRAEGLEGVPEHLTRGGRIETHWLAPDLLFTQTCGYPLTHGLSGRVRLIATPCYRAAGCHGPSYCSVVLVRAESPAGELAELRGARCAVNHPHSQSGYSALRALAAPLSRGGRFFGSVEVTGSHTASIARLASGAADVAAVDAVTHALLARHRPDALSATRVLCRSASAPGLPYVTRADASEDAVRRLRAGLAEAFADPALAPARDALLLEGFEVLPLAAYDRIVEIERHALSHGYPEIV